MFELLRRILRARGDEFDPRVLSSAADTDVPPAEVLVGGVAFPIAQYMQRHEGYPILDWEPAQAWTSGIESQDLQERAWAGLERAWLLHFRDALGSRFHLRESKSALLLSSLESNVSRATLEYMERTLKRVIASLDGIAQTPSWGKDILIVFDDTESYYRYVSYYYPDAGDFGLSSGMHIDSGCSHYVTVKADLRSIEPIIAHEMMHGCVGHLPLPAWLNEGLAVNIESRLAGSRPAYTPQQLRNKHLTFWHAQEMQEFWSGKSFLRTDDGSLLSYELARLIVEQMANDWQAFKRFVLAANGADAGAAAARKHLGVDLGAYVCVLLEKEPTPAWSPDPGMWDAAPERGRFVAVSAL